MKYYEVNNRKIHQVKVSLMYEDYVGALIYEVGGNTMGKSILEAALQAVEYGNFVPIDHELNRAHVNIVNEYGYIEEVVLFNDQDTLTIEIRDIEDIIIGAQIISYREDD
ncbi:hypothetical protein [Paenibacillus polymyxa]|uniref:hypothetical protein n=1 Tax=Paenibacillus polymyxa TaxID=1406 RepID=UPI0003FA31F3|nr:hypothetical protein [Paenibacillus polymyxa]